MKLPVQRRPLGPVLAIASAALFGASTPLAKLLIGGGINPWLLASFLYLGSGIGLGMLRLARGAHGEAPLRRGDLPWRALPPFFWARC